MFRMFQFFCFCLGMPLVLLIMCGCGGSGPTIVEGTVSINGNKLNHGTIKLTSSDGKSRTSPITAQGSYQITGGPTGEIIATVEVDKDRLAQIKTSLPKEFAEKYKDAPSSSEKIDPVPIDPKYSQSANGSKITVVPGRRQTINIDFK